MGFLRPPLHGLTGRVLRAYFVVELTFAVLIDIGLSYVVGVSTTVERDTLVVRCLLVGGVSVAAMLAVFAVLLRPVERWIAADRARRATHEELRAATRRLHRIPALFAAIQTGKWLVAYTSLGVMHGVPSVPALVMFLGTFVFGPPPIGHTLAMWLTGPALRRASQAADAVGVAGLFPRRTLRSRIVFYATCMCLAPTCYMASIVFTAQAQSLSVGDVAFVVGSYFLAVIVFAGVCAALLTTNVTTQIHAMATAVQAVADAGYVAGVHRIPIQANDELGQLSTLANHMIDALGRKERARIEASESVAELAQKLELRVIERTSSLEQAIAARAGEMERRIEAERELRQAQKLEAVGRLAAGIAHEINTPIQFVGDSVEFLRDAMAELARLVAGYQALQQAALAGGPCAAQAAATVEIERDVDLAYVTAQVPAAIGRALDGVARVGAIVRSMKQFAYPDRDEMHAADLNDGIAATLTVAKGEYKHVADLDLDLGDLPPVRCYAGEINQVILNLVVNAAHAIGDVVERTGTRGRIHVRSLRDGDHAVIEVADTGGGIPTDIQPHIFDVFFTTKPIGVGTGQGLALARQVVVEKHGGALTFDTEVGRGTRFRIRLPIVGCPRKPSRPAIAA